MLNKPDRALKELAKINKFSRDYWYLRAWAAYKLKSYQESRKFLLKALETNPDDLQLLYLLTQSERRLGNYKEAEKHISRLIELYPEHAASRELYAIVMMGLKKKKAMKKAFREARRLRGESQNNLLNATTATIMGGKLEDVINSIERALVERPDDPLAHSFAADYYKKNWQYKRALKHATYAARLEPGEKDYQKQLRKMQMLNNPIHRPFSQVIYLDKKYRHLPMVVLTAIFSTLFLYGIFTDKTMISVISLNILVNMIIGFAAYGFISFIIAKFYQAFKESRH